MRTRCLCMLKTITRYLSPLILSLVSRALFVVSLNKTFIWFIIISFHYDFTWQSISGGRSFAEILFNKVKDDPGSSKELLLRGCSLHKVCFVLNPASQFWYYVLCSPFYFSLYVIESNQMIRLITFTICGGAYLNFMGNEFGHPDVSLFSMCYPWKVMFMQLTIFSCARGLNSRCQAIISHFHVLTVDGIWLQMVECIMIYMSLIRWTMISLHVIESAEIISYTDYFFPT